MHSHFAAPALTRAQQHARILAPLELQERVRRTISRMNYLYNRF